MTDTIAIPSDLPDGTYEIGIALLDRAGTDPTTEPLAPLFLGIEGRGPDGWYSLSAIEVAR